MIKVRRSRIDNWSGTRSILNHVVLSAFVLAVIVTSNSVLAESGLVARGDLLTNCVAGMSPGTWKDTTTCPGAGSNKSLSSVAYANVINPPAPLTYHAELATTINGVSGPNSLVATWGSAAWDSDDKWLIILNSGGHGAYNGNEAYAWKAQDLQWHRLNDPSNPGNVKCSDYAYPDGSPIPLHNYGVMNYDRTTHSVLQASVIQVSTNIGLCRNLSFTGDVTVGSNVLTNVSPDPATAGVQVTDIIRCATCNTADIGQYNEATKVTSNSVAMALAAKGSTNQTRQTLTDNWIGRSKPAIISFDLTTHIWSQRTTNMGLGCLTPDLVTVIDASTNRLYASQGAGPCDSASWTIGSAIGGALTGSGSFQGYHNSGAIVPGKMMIVMGAPTGIQTLAFVPGAAWRVQTTTGDKSCQNYQGPNFQSANGIVWDSKIHKLIAFLPGSSTICELDPATWAWTSFAMSGDAPSPEDSGDRGDNGIFGRFQYDVTNDILIEVSCFSCHVFVGKLP